MPRAWTRDAVFELLARNDEAVGRALLSLREEQTSLEVRMESTILKNGVGFTQADARIMTSMAGFFERRGFLTPRQLAWLRSGRSKKYPSRIGKYAGQLAKKVEERRTA